MAHPQPSHRSRFHPKEDLALAQPRAGAAGKHVDACHRPYPDALLVPALDEGLAGAELKCLLAGEGTMLPVGQRLDPPVDVRVPHGVE